jgi:hypothetical protein
MRLLTSIFLIIFFMSCVGQISSYFIPKEFEYPDDSIGNGKTFIYRDIVNKQNAYLDIRLFNIGTKKLRSFVQHNPNLIRDSEIICDGKRVEFYYQLSTVDPKMSKGEDIVDKIINDGGKFGRHISSRTFHDNVIILKISVEENVIKDTSILWMGNYLGCIETQKEGKIEIRSSKYPTLNFDGNLLSKCYYAKRIGIIRYSMAYKDRKKENHYIMWDLSSIEDIDIDKIHN